MIYQVSRRFRQCLPSTVSLESALQALRFAGCGRDLFLSIWRKFFATYRQCAIYIASDRLASFSVQLYIHQCEEDISRTPVNHPRCLIRGRVAHVTLSGTFSYDIEVWSSICTCFAKTHYRPETQVHPFLTPNLGSFGRQDERASSDNEEGLGCCTAAWSKPTDEYGGKPAGFVQQVLDRHIVCLSAGVAPRAAGMSL